ncbi:MAG: 6-pyruvoyl tetrahydrobiopterin synthase [Gammaproteobacteria bacterium]|jgi:6-pyruvoyltetrahydropterin/6-carboxytetrahydropterin synthase|nr:6-pyruvoyl tetrahydrobiopterin synthase [Gammaproteobacteria bacterium]
MNAYTVIELNKEYMGFDAAHFTIYSATHRERLHGHNFRVYASLTAKVDDNGMTFDYGLYKQKIRTLCDELRQYTLIADHSPYLRVVEDGDYLYAHFYQEKIPFLKKDVKRLPLRNITVEELSRWFIEKLTMDTKNLELYSIQHIVIKICSAPGQCGSCEWRL